MTLVVLQGPLSVFCARARWGPVHVICLQRGEGGLGLTLRGDSPVLVAGVVPGGCAAVSNITDSLSFAIVETFLSSVSKAMFNINVLFSSFAMPV